MTSAAARGGINRLDGHPRQASRRRNGRQLYCYNAGAPDPRSRCLMSRRVIGLPDSGGVMLRSQRDSSRVVKLTSAVKGLEIVIVA